MITEDDKRQAIIDYRIEQAKNLIPEIELLIQLASVFQQRQVGEQD